MRSTRTRLLALLSSLALVGACEGPNNLADSGVLEPYPDSPTVLVAGYVWDPEAIQYSFGMCGPACSLRPLIGSGQTYFERSVVGNAQLELIDLSPDGVPYSTQSGDAGLWVIDGVARFPEPYLYPVAWKERNGPPPSDGGADAGAADGGPRDAGMDAGSDGGFDAGDDAGFDAGVVDAGGSDAGGSDAGASDAGPRDGGADGGSSDGGADAGAADGGTAPPFLGPVPVATTYFPTLTITTAISPRVYQCLGRGAAVIGNTGILEALAKYLTNTGRPTVAGDFVDPQKFGGVIIWWAYASGGSTTRAGASGVSFTASEGQLIHVSWGCPAGSTCPPGPPIPGPGMATKSARNYYVLAPPTDGGLPTSNVGLSVTLLPPAGIAQTVSYTLTDPVVDAAKGRPYKFTPLPHVTAQPGRIIFGQTQAIPALVSSPAGYDCIPAE